MNIMLNCHKKNNSINIQHSSNEFLYFILFQVKMYDIDGTNWLKTLLFSIDINVGPGTCSTLKLFKKVVFSSKVQECKLTSMDIF